MGVFTDVDYSGIDRRIVVQRSQDVEPIIEHLAALRQVSDGKSESGDLYYVGDIPNVIVEQYLAETGVNFHEFIKDPVHIRRIMLDPAYSKFRVWQGRF